MSNSKSSSSLLALIGVLVVLTLCVVSCSEQVKANPVQENNNNNLKKDEPEPLSLFPVGQECPEGEVLTQGVLPTCEPTCENPKPVCIKMFSYSLDFVPCFCKEPMVRNKQTGKCVQLGDCPTTVNKQQH